MLKCCMWGITNSENVDFFPILHLVGEHFFYFWDYNICPKLFNLMSKSGHIFTNTTLKLAEMTANKPHSIHNHRSQHHWRRKMTSGAIFLGQDSCSICMQELKVPIMYKGWGFIMGANINQPVEFLSSTSLCTSSLMAILVFSQPPIIT